jgi:hypothetical protein
MLSEDDLCMVSETWMMHANRNVCSFLFAFWTCTGFFVLRWAAGTPWFLTTFGMAGVDLYRSSLFFWT